MDACEDKQVLRWYGTQASSDNGQRVIKNAVSEASMHTTTPNWCAVLSCGVYQGKSRDAQCLGICTPSRSRKSPQQRQPVKVTPHPDVQPGPTTLQKLFSEWDDVPLSGHTVNKFRRPAVLQLNIEGLIANKMNVLHHLAVQYDTLVILLQETHCSCADKLIIFYC